MSGLAIDIEVEGGTELANSLNEAIAFMGSPDRINAEIGYAAYHGIAGRNGEWLMGFPDWIRKMAETRHEVSGRLGSPQTGYFNIAADSMTLEVTETAAFLTIRKNAEGFACVQGPVTIKPTGTFQGKPIKWLTIPMCAEAVGRGVESFAPVYLGFFVSKNGQTAIWYRRPPSKPRLAKVATAAQAATPARPRAATTTETSGDFTRHQIVYVGKREVTQPQDRGRLPSDEHCYELIGAALDKVFGWLFNSGSSRATSGFTFSPLP